MEYSSCISLIYLSLLCTDKKLTAVFDQLVLVGRNVDIIGETLKTANVKIVLMVV